MLLRDAINKKYICEKYNSTKKYNAFVNWYLENDEIFESEAKFLFAAKDLYLIEGKTVTAGSKKLHDFVSPYTSTIIKQLKEAGGVCVGHTNMDEFAMGSSGKTSAYGITESIWKKNGEPCSPGGSSSGAAVALTLGLCSVSLGTDTGGSVRQPACWNGIFGFKPTYGVFSRYGIIPFDSQLDHPSYFTNTAENAKFIFNLLAKEDLNDNTSVNYDLHEKELPNIKRKVAFYTPNGTDDDSKEALELVRQLLKEENYEIIDIDIKLMEYTLNIYYIFNTTQAFSNLSRYNSITLSKDNKEFGEEVKRRMSIGEAMCSISNKEGYYDRSGILLQQFWEGLEPILNDVDMIIMPTASAPMTIAESLNPDPIKMYQCDMYISFCNLLGIPSMHVPTHLHNNLPTGVQLVSRPFGDKRILEMAILLDKHFNFYNKHFKDSSIL